MGDVEGEAIVSLAKLYEKSNEEDQAASAFSRYVQDSELEGILKFEDLSHAYRLDCYFDFAMVIELH